MLQSLIGHRQPVIGYRQETKVKTITPTELYEQLQDDNAPLVVDVRSPEEYEYNGHIAGSRLLPLPALRQRSSELPQDRPLVFVCRSGARSQAACEQLASQGFSNVINMVGGMMAWQRAGLPSQ